MIQKHSWMHTLCLYVRAVCVDAAAVGLRSCQGTLAGHVRAVAGSGTYGQILHSSSIGKA